MGRASLRRAAATVVLVPLALIAVLGAGWSTRAGAASDTSTTNDQTEMQQCLGNAPIGLNPPTCIFDSNGHLISRSTSGPTAPGSSLNLGPFIVIALIWSAVPFVIAVSIARSRNEPVGTAVLLTLVLGWIGLGIVAYGQRRTAEVVSRAARAPADSERVDAPRASAADRLRTIDDLYAQKLISAAERNERRAAVLDELGPEPDRATRRP